MALIDSINVNGTQYELSSSDFIKSNVSYNHITVDTDTMVTGKLKSDGTVDSNASYKTSDFIEWTADPLYRAATKESNNNYTTACYDESQTFLGMATLVDENNALPDKDGTVFYYVEFSLEAGTKYIRTSAYMDVSALYLSEDELPENFDIDGTYITVDRGPEIATAMGIPNLDFISRFAGKKMIVAGDSITEKNTTSSKVWHEWIAEWLGLTVYNDGKGGTGFAKGYTTRHSTIYRVENLWSSLYPADPDIILVMGNMNDGTAGGAGYAETYPEIVYGYAPPVGQLSDPGTTFSEHGIMRRLLTDLTNKYPTAKIGIISSTPRDYPITSQWPDNPNTYGYGWYHDYVEAQKEVCADFGIPFLDIYHQNPVLRPYNQTNAQTYYWDGEASSPTNAVHPNEAGHLEGIARPVYEWMLGWI